MSLLEFSMPKFKKGNNSEKAPFYSSPDNLLIIFYQLTMFEAASYNNFWDILITRFNALIWKGQQLQKNKITCF